jgi:alpha-galactosidase
MRHNKIAMIGAGSVVFCKTLIADILATPALRGSEFALMSPTETKLRRMEAFIGRMIADNGLPARVWATTDRREAITDADFVVVMIQVGGFEAYGHDYEIPLKYGVDQCIGDTLGPGGVFRGLRHIPVLVDIARDMEQVARPGAIMLQYANPMAANCLALGRVSRVPFVGLCHGVQTTLDLIAGYCGIADKHEITYTCGGINHMDWFLRLEHQGRDLYPELREKFERPEYYKNEKVRGEVFRHFGYFMTESTGHLSEYVPWFRKHRRALDLYCDEPAFGGESGAYYKWGKTMAEKYATVDPLQFEDTACDCRSVEYCSWIMEAVATGKPFRFMGNVYNAGLHRQPAARQLRRGADVRRRHGPAAHARGKAPAAVRGRLHDQRERAAAHGRRRADRRSRAHRARAGARSAHRRRVHPERDPRHGHGDARGAADVAARVRGPLHPPDADDQHPTRCEARRGAARPGAGDSPAVREAGVAADGMSSPACSGVLSRDAPRAAAVRPRAGRP